MTSGANPDGNSDRSADPQLVPQLVVDALGRRCPIPVIELARRIGDVAVGETVELRADDPAAGPDVTAWCRMRGHELLGETPLSTGAGAAYRIRRLS